MLMKVKDQYTLSSNGVANRQPAYRQPQRRSAAGPI